MDIHTTINGASVTAHLRKTKNNTFEVSFNDTDKWLAVFIYQGRIILRKPIYEFGAEINSIKVSDEVWQALIKQDKEEYKMELALVEKISKACDVLTELTDEEVCYFENLTQRLSHITFSPPQTGIKAYPLGKDVQHYASLFSVVKQLRDKARFITDRQNKRHEQN